MKFILRWFLLSQEIYYDEEYDSDNDRFILHKIYNPEYQSDDNLKFFYQFAMDSIS